MTDDQKYRQRVELMIEFEKAKDNTNALRNALKAEADSVSAVAEWIENAAHSLNVSKLGSEFFSRRISDHVNILEDARFRESMNLDRAASLREEFIAAQLRMEELAARLREIKAA